MLNYKVAFIRHTKVIAVYNPEHDIIRLTFTPSYHQQPRPGTHYYLHFPFILKAVGNHPFTMCGWTHGGQISPVAALNRSITNDHEKVNMSPMWSESNSDCEMSQESNVKSPTKLHFLIRPHKGLTSCLRDAINKSGTRFKELTALVEGPYGETAPVFQYDTVIFVAGGSGISVVLAYIQEFLNQSTTEFSRRIITKRARIIWAARQHAFISDVMNTELAEASSNPKIKFDLFVTGSSPPAIKNHAVDLEWLPDDVRFRYERPDVGQILRQEAADSVGSVAIVVCGPAKLADDSRRAAVGIVGSGFEGLGYFEEQFGW